VQRLTSLLALAGFAIFAAGCAGSTGTSTGLLPLSRTAASVTKPHDIGGGTPIFGGGGGGQAKTNDVGGGTPIF